MRNRFPGGPQNGGFRELLSYGATPINAHTVLRMLSFSPAVVLTEEESERYGHKQLLNDMYELFLPVYRSTLTFNDINFILAIYHSPNVSMAIRHLSIFDDMPGEEMSKYLTPAINAIIAGEKPEPVKLNEGISPSYLEASGAYYESTGRGDMLKQLKNVADQNGNEGGAKHLSQIVDYLLANNAVVYANVGNGKVTEDEFRLIAGLYETTAFQHFRAGHLNLSSQSTTILPKIIERAKAWKEKKDKGNQ